ncbi:DUF2493 domain-containing protein [Sphingomonas sp. AR_OL41]|uniref:DUF2493 domain-containing protein n=1 Tax=Sphingomonas sp. AR_OL41 TaxID=3042729 RepID=UPI00247FAD3B|nr:DUF2493 domain-containing protein [Sphingomonas sp. AR_OL41]MDH7973928.1 DUF2493 domain-containing protein [Sphingomonas sp. AR_OL41]
MSSDHEPEHQESQTGIVLHELSLYAYRPFSDEADPRPLPEDRLATGAVIDTFDALVSALQDTRIEPDLEDLLWGITNVFHRLVERIERELDDNEVAQRNSQRDQDGSEVKSVELERLLREGTTIIERRDTMELFRDVAVAQFRLHLRKPWTPRSGSVANRKALTASMIDSRDFIAARRQADREVLVPAGPKIALSAGSDFNDHKLIWEVLDRVRAKYPDMVLLHGGSTSGGERIAACWADARKVTQIAFKPDWARHAKAAPFKRNDAMLAVLPIGVIIFPGSGIQDNLADKARALGIRPMDYRRKGGG